MQQDKLQSELEKRLKASNWGNFSLEQRQKLVDYIFLLHKWNKVYNLTGRKDFLESLDLNVMDSLSLLTELQPKSDCLNQPKILDVGTGAGLPGIPLAITRPDLKVTLLECKQKKVNFLQHAVINLGLNNITVICSRIEDYKTDDNFAVICSRAFSAIDNYLNLVGRFCSKESKVIVMQKDVNKYLNKENFLASKDFSVEAVKKINLPLKQWSDRCLIIMRRKNFE